MTNLRPTSISRIRMGAATAAIALAGLLGVLATQSVQAQTYQILYDFGSNCGQQYPCTDGAYPRAGLLRDSAGNLYGTTYFGGVTCKESPTFGCGVVFKIDAKGVFSDVYRFKGGRDGGLPLAGLVMDKHGNLYGSTSFGGRDFAQFCRLGCGTVFKIDSNGSETVLVRFAQSGGGFYSSARVEHDSAGNLYGTTTYGGNQKGQCADIGCGTVFQLTPQRKPIVLHRFRGGADGRNSETGVIRDAARNFYGTTAGGGHMDNNNCPDGCGTVFKVDQKGHWTVLYAFMGGSDGAFPSAGNLTLDSSGNLYGATYAGGITACGSIGNQSCGTIFKIDPSGKETVLYRFANTVDGSGPLGGLTRDAQGNLYGTTFNGGTFFCDPDNCGTIFKVDPNGKKTTLYNFDGIVGAGPNSDLVMDAAGNLYGTAIGGGHQGVVFELTP